MLSWAQSFSIFCFLDHNHYSTSAQFEFCLAAGLHTHIELKPGQAYSDLQNFCNEKPRWLFGHLGYELKNEIEHLPTPKAASINFGLGYFFEPQILIIFKNGHLQISSKARKPELVFKAICHTEVKVPLHSNNQNISLLPVYQKETYLKNIALIKNHIALGNCYEVNYCQQFIAENARVNAAHLFHKLNEASPNPFAAFYKLKDKYCLCASPERYLQKLGQQLISQPIKGTSKRNLLDDLDDEQRKNYLLKSVKERAENVMVVDLVRNDLSKVCQPGTVQVKELFGLYSFPQVHQMISTVVGQMPTATPFTEAIKASFPMGSMTGAPKKKVMEVITQTEPESRGLFSGAIGYITPQLNFDFNVVIRSIFYDETKALLTAWAGGGITHYSDAAQEYEESLLKISAIKKLLEN